MIAESEGLEDPTGGLTAGSVSQDTHSFTDNPGEGNPPLAGENFHARDTLLHMPGRGRRLLVVEDEALTASLLAEALTAHGFVVETAADVLAARQAVKDFDPDAALIDISLGVGPSGLDLAHALSKQRPDIALLILTKYADPRTSGENAPAVPLNCGFLRKDKIRDTEYLLEQLESVLADAANDVRHDLIEPNPLSALTPRQLEVLRLMAMGYTNDFIAQYTESSLSSVERWVMQVFRAFDLKANGNLNPRVEAVRIFGQASGLPERL
jgi:DNA-binding NarL/FixJ family response regulator